MGVVPPWIRVVWGVWWKKNAFPGLIFFSAGAAGQKGKDREVQARPLFIRITAVLLL